MFGKFGMIMVLEWYGHWCISPQGKYFFFNMLKENARVVPIAHLPNCKYGARFVCTCMHSAHFISMHGYKSCSQGEEIQNIFFFYCSWGSKALFSVTWLCAFFQGVDLLFIYIYYVKNSAKLSEEGDGVLRRYKVDMVLRVLLWQSPNTCM